MNYIKAAAVSPELRVADVAYNTKEILHIVHRRLSDDVSAVLFPELSLTGYTPADLFFTEDLLHASEEALRLIAEETKELDLILVVGLPLRHRNRLFNTAAVLHRAKCLGLCQSSIYQIIMSFMRADGLLLMIRATVMRFI